MSPDPIAFETRFPPERDARTARVSPLTRRLVAPNGGPFTYTGTCAYVVGSGQVAIVDPGPKSEAQVEALLDAIAGERLAAILVTHTHLDHSPPHPSCAHARARPSSDARRINRSTAE